MRVPTLGGEGEGGLRACAYLRRDVRVWPSRLHFPYTLDTRKNKQGETSDSTWPPGQRRPLHHITLNSHPTGP